MELSLLANFDDLRRCDDILTDGTAEIGKQRTAFFSHHRPRIAVFLSHIGRI